MSAKFDEWWKTVECNEANQEKLGTHTRFCGANVSLIRAAFEAGAKAERTLLDELDNMDRVLRSESPSQHSLEEKP